MPSVQFELRTWRQEAGLTQAELAQLVGISQQGIAKLEQPNSNPTLATIAKLAGALGLTVAITVS